MGFFGFGIGNRNPIYEQHPANVHHATPGEVSEQARKEYRRWRRCRRGLCLAGRVLLAVVTVGVSECVMLCISAYRARHAQNRGALVVHHSEGNERQRRRYSSDDDGEDFPNQVGDGGEDDDDYWWDHNADYKARYRGGDRFHPS